MGVRDDLNDLLDALLGEKKPAKKPPRAPGLSGPAPRLASGARDALADAEAVFQHAVLFGPPELPIIDKSPAAGVGYLSLPPHIHPSATARAWYERRAQSVDAGASAFILDFTADPDSIVYWATVGTDQHLNSLYEFWVDGTIFEPITGAAQVGTVLNPYRFPGAIPVKSLRLRAYNFNPTPFTYEVVVAGWTDRKG